MGFKIKTITIDADFFLGCLQKPVEAWQCVKAVENPLPRDARALAVRVISAHWIEILVESNEFPEVLLENIEKTTYQARTIRNLPEEL